MLLLDVFITFVLCIFIFYPSLLDSLNSMVGRLLFLVFIYIISTQNVILALVAGIIFILYLVPKQTIMPKSMEKYSLLPLDESIRPKDSTCIPVDRNSVAPPREELLGSSQTTFANNNIGNYAQFNL